jgi:hypothetical protein
MSHDFEAEAAKLLASFVEAPEDATNSTPRPDEIDKLDKLLDREPSSWRPIPLEGPVEDDTPPSVLAIEGTSRHLLYPGSTNSIYAESESGKSLLAIVAAREVIERGGRVLWLDYEDTARRFRSRLDSMSVPRELWSSIDYVNPAHALWSTKTNASTVAHADFVEMLRRGRYELAVVDTMTGAMSVEGLDPNVGTEVEQLYRVLTGEIVKTTGAAVLVLDHVPKSTEAKRYAIGSERKLSGITGASYVLEVTRPWSRALGGEPVYGAAELKITKDRPGYVRGGRSELSTVASIEVTADPDGGLRIRVVDPRDTVPVPPIELVTKIVDHLRRFPGTSKSALETELGGKANTVRAARDWLVDRGAITVEARGNGSYLSLNETRLRELDLA